MMNDEKADERRVLWLRWGLFFSVVAVFGITFRESFVYLATMWSTEDSYSQGWLIAAVSIYICAAMIFRQRIEPGPPRIRYIPVVILLSLFWGIGYLTQTLLLQLVVLPALFWFCVFCCLGHRIAKAWFFPTAYFCISLPVWGMLSPLLQSLTVDMTAHIVRLWGIPMHIVGNMVTIPAGRFEIVSGCSGIHQFAVAVAYTVLAAYLSHATWWRQVLLVIAGLVLAMIANWARVSGLVIIGQYTNMQHYLIKVEHVSFGWGLFALFVVIPILLLSRHLGHTGGPLHRMAATEPGGGNVKKTWGVFVVPVLVAMALLPGPLLSRAAEADMDDATSRIVLRNPGGRWSGPEPVTTDWRPWYFGADQTLAGTYVSGDTGIDLFVISYFRESQGRELINQNNRIADPSIWSVKSVQRATTGAGSDMPMSWTEVRIATASGRSRVIRYWYDIGGHRAIRPATAKLMQAWAKLGHSSRASLIAVGATCSSDCADARRTLDYFMSSGPQNFVEIGDT